MCLQFQILGDDFREDNETFTVLLESENQLDVIAGDITQIPVTILNDEDRESHACIVNMLLELMTFLLVQLYFKSSSYSS